MTRHGNPPPTPRCENTACFSALAAASLALLQLAPGVDQNGQAPRAKPFTLQQVWALEAIYIDQQHGVSFRYPSAWKPTTQFGYHPPALTARDETRPIAGFGYEEGGFPRARTIGPYSATNLEGFGIVYAAVAATNATACDTLASSFSQTPAHQTVLVGRLSFSEHNTAEAGMSQTNAGRLYATYLPPTCYLFETDVALATGALDSVSDLSPEQQRSIQTNLWKIMKTVRITPHEKR